MAWWRSPIAALDGAPSGLRHSHASIPHDYWAVPASKLLGALHSGPDGLGARAAALRLRRYGPNVPGETRRLSAVRLFLRQFESPLILILVAAAAVAALVRDWTNAVIVLLIVLGSGVLSFAQEYRASTALEKLRAKVRITCTMLRGGKTTVVPSRDVVPGDIVLLSAGSLIPADGVLLDAKDFFVSQAVLTGESFPTEKMPGVCASSATVAERTNCAFMGTSVRNGTARMLVIHTGASTVFGNIAGRLRLRQPETEFERGVRRYGYLLTQLMLLLVLVVFAANILLHRAPIESLLFAIALAVGLSPELLPAIISITLSQGARQMAAHGVIVRRLSAIENLGSMDVLCSDKTGTLTEGVMNLDAALDFAGQPSAEALHAACLNAALQTGLANPLDEAIVARGQRDGIDIASYRKLDEIPYDFVRKRLSVLVQGSGGSQRCRAHNQRGIDAACCRRAPRCNPPQTCFRLRLPSAIRSPNFSPATADKAIACLAWRGSPCRIRRACTRADENVVGLSRLSALPRSAQGRNSTDARQSRWPRHPA